jgi:hypothetical protein
MRLWAGSAVLVAVLVCAAPVRAGTLVLVKESPSTQFPAGTRVWTSPGATLDLHGSSAGVRLYSSAGNDPAYAYTLFMEPPSGGALVAGGVYDHALSTADWRHPRLTVAGEGTSCEGGRFQVLDIAMGDEGVIQKLWAVFACSAETERPATFGEVRIGTAGDMVPALVRWPATDVGWRGSPVPVTFIAPATVTVSSAVLAGVDAAAFAITADGCSGRMLSAGQRCTVSVVHRADALGSVAATLRLNLAGGGGRESALEAFAYGGTTRLRLDSESGDPVGGGVDYEYRPGAGMFVAGRSASGIGARVAAGDISFQLAVVPGFSSRSCRGRGTS